MQRLYRPRRFFGVLGWIVALASGVLAVPVVNTYLQTGLVPRLPTALLATGLGLLGALLWFARPGARQHQSARAGVPKRLGYLSVPPTPQRLEP